jgi:hypothetical protein
MTRRRTRTPASSIAGCPSDLARVAARDARDREQLGYVQDASERHRTPLPNDASRSDWTHTERHFRVDRLGWARGRVIATEWSLSHRRGTVPGVEFGRAGGDRRDRSAGSATTDPAVAALSHVAARLPRARAPSFPVRRLTRTSRAPCSQHLRQGLLDQGWSREHGKPTHRGPPRRTFAPNDDRQSSPTRTYRHLGRSDVASCGELWWAAHLLVAVLTAVEPGRPPRCWNRPRWTSSRRR